MQVAEILSDLTSLRVCGHNEALALVNVHKATGLSPQSNEDGAPAVEGAEQKKKTEDLRRAKELVQLHYEVKARHVNGEVDEELRRAREDVSRVLRELAR